MKTYTDQQLDSVITWFLKNNPESINLMLSNAQQFLIEALSAEQKFLSEIVVNENKMSAFVEYIAPMIFNTINPV